VALAATAISFFGDGPNLSKDISGKASYSMTSTSLMIEVGNLFWVPLATKYGKRPVYIASFLLLTVCSVWCGVAKSFTSELVARIILGTACGAPEIIAPLTLADIFFLHQ
jgi:MFS family permease